MKKVLALLFIAANSLAQTHFTGQRLRENKAMVTVLEAPLFPAPDANARVIQYVRKGEEIYIHPAEFQKDRYEAFVEKRPEALAAAGEKYRNRYFDPLFDDADDVYTPDPDSKFYKTLAADGQEAYVLKEHVFLLYNDLRELTQKVPRKDPTDYRIEEPLPKGFPLVQPSGRRGFLSLGFGVPAAPAYPYRENVKDSGHGLLKEFAAVWANKVEDVSERFFFGGMGMISQYSLEHQLEERLATEKNIKISAGPYVSYDLWKRPGFVLNLQGSAQIVLVDILDIEQTGPSDTESRSFTSYHISPRAALAAHFPEKVFGLDLLAGASAQAQLSRSYASETPAANPSWWKGDRFDQIFYSQITFFLGLQSNF